MSKASRILLIALLALSASVWLGATGVAPEAPVEVAQATAPVQPSEGMGEGSGSGFGFAFGEGSYLGIDSQDVTKERMADLKLKEERGVEVLMVDADAPAGKAGLKEHDVILEFNGTRLEGVEQLRRLIHETPAGRSVTLGISRDGQAMTLTATLADRGKSYTMSSEHKVFKMPKVVIPKMPPIGDVIVISGSASSGLLVESLTPQLGEYFGVKNGEGVLVRSVEKGSPGEAAGFRAGDVIVRVEKDKVADRGDWRSAMRSHRSGKVSIGIIRERKEQTLSLALPESKDQSRVWRMEMPELEDLDIDLDQMDIEIDRLGPEMERLNRELNGQLSASVTQGRDEMRKAMALAREQQRAAQRVQLDATRAAQKARLDALRALAQQRKQLEKARVKMLQQREMD
jgi:membrane-associated protease RseP (regulator of RpoE activity)